MSEIRAYALVKDGKTINIIAWDGETAYTPPDGCELVLAEDAPALEKPTP